MNYNDITEKKKILDGFRPLPDVLVNNLDEWFRGELTYASKTDGHHR
jgi:hypothetical protein